METPNGTENDARNRRAITFMWVVLALALIATFYVGYLVIKRRGPVTATPQAATQPVQLPAQPSRPVFLPFVGNSVIDESATPTPANQSIWMIVYIDSNDVGTFEKADDPNQIIIARCKDPNRPTPEMGTLYRLKKTGILVAFDEGESKKLQRFEQVAGK